MSREAQSIAWRVALALVAGGALLALGVARSAWGVAVLGPVVITGVLWFSLRRPLRAWSAARAPLGAARPPWPRPTPPAKHTRSRSKQHRASPWVRRWRSRVRITESRWAGSGSTTNSLAHPW